VDGDSFPHCSIPATSLSVASMADLNVLLYEIWLKTSQDGQAQLLFAAYACHVSPEVYRHVHDMSATSIAFFVVEM